MKTFYFFLISIFIMACSTVNVDSEPDFSLLKGTWVCQDTFTFGRTEKEIRDNVPSKKVVCADLISFTSDSTFTYKGKEREYNLKDSIMFLDVRYKLQMVNNDSMILEEMVSSFYTTDVLLRLTFKKHSK